MSEFEMKALIRLNSALIVGCLPKGIINPYEGTILTTGKVCCVQYLLVFRLVSGYTGERLISGLRRKDWILRALLLAVAGLWPHKVGSRGEIYSARWKLLLISDQAKDGGSMSPFQLLVYIPDLPCDDLFGEGPRILRRNLTKFRQR